MKVNSTLTRFIFYWRHPIYPALYVKYFPNKLVLLTAANNPDCDLFHPRRKAMIRVISATFSGDIGYMYPIYRTNGGIFRLSTPDTAAAGTWKMVENELASLLFMARLPIFRIPFLGSNSGMWVLFAG